MGKFDEGYDKFIQTRAPVGNDGVAFGFKKIKKMLSNFC
jgi:hypothetical protein